MNDQNQVVASFAERLNEALKIREKTAADLSKLTGIKESSISCYKNGKYEAGQWNLDKITKALDVSITWLMGFDVPFGPRERVPGETNLEDLYNQYDNISPISTKKIPLLGTIACGEPKYADEDFEGYVDVGADVKADFCLHAKGNSMINIGIKDGYVVFVRKQDYVDNGEVAAVVIDGEATLKRFNKYGDTIVLKAENPEFDDIVYTNGDVEDIRILGKAVAFQGDVK